MDCRNRRLGEEVCMYVLLCFQICVCCVSLVFLNENQKCNGFFIWCLVGLRERERERNIKSYGRLWIERERERQNIGTGLG